MRKRLRGAPPKRLTGHIPVRADESPWWDHVASELLRRNDLMGEVITVDELVQMIPSYPDGRPVRGRAAVRRLTNILELVCRGPNGSLSREASYRIVRPTPPIPSTVVADSTVEADQEWLLSSIERMIGGKKP